MSTGSSAPRYGASAKEAGLSQTAVAQKSGITFQQVQKYENGTNRITVSRLFEIARTLGVPVSAFLDELIDPGTP